MAIDGGVRRPRGGDSRPTAGGDSRPTAGGATRPPRGEELFAEVAVPVPVRRTFTYRVPDLLRGEVQPGRQVTVPFGKRQAEGFVVALSDRATMEDVKEIRSVDGAGPLFTSELLALTRWIADYYLCSWGEVLKAALPGGIEPTAPGRRRRAAPAAEAGEARGGAPFEDDHSPAAADITLTGAQAGALEAIRAAMAARTHRTILLHGITGSGKTEIYLRAAALAEAEGGQALILVPEISLSPQMVRHCRSRFGERVVVWHSALPLGLRREAWRRVRDGAASVVVGARSAVFAPFADLRLIVVDEEHEAAYKQDETPRYHGRDVAVYRGALARVPVVLGSATPSLESYHHALAGKYALIELPRRIDDRPTPTVDLVPLVRGRDEGRAEASPGGAPPGAGRPEAGGEARPPGGAPPASSTRSRSHILSEPLIAALEDRLARAEQAILFLNRRGHSTVVRCDDCGHVARCPHCDISLTWHADRRELCCHYCAHRVRQFDVCPDCGGACFVYRGVGTQKVEAELGRLLPQARTVRMDFDTTRRRGVMDGIVRDFRARRADILLGTQMVARGLDFPGVTLVGVINADTQLNLPDFRSAERTFQLLTQVAGRAGRGRQPGHVLVQTFASGHYAIEAARGQDYRAFYETEMEFRREVGYPPLTRMVNLLFDGREEARVMQRAEETARHLSARLGGREPPVDLLGPAPQSLSRLKGKYRWHVTLKGRDHRVLRGLAEEALALPASPGSPVRLSVDVDPVSLL